MRRGNLSEFGLVCCLFLQLEVLLARGVTRRRCYSLEFGGEWAGLVGVNEPFLLLVREDHVRGGEVGV